MSRDNVEQVHPQNDVETASSVEAEVSDSKELHHKRSMKRLCYVAVIVLLLTIVILVFTTTVFHVHSPKFRIRSITIDELSVSSSNAIDMKFETEIGIKNNNFAEFEFEKTSVGFFYRGTRVSLVDGDAMVEEGNVKPRSTKKVQFTAEMRTTNSIFVDDVKSGALTLTGNGKLSGTVHLMKLIKMKRSFEMNCTININLNKKVVQDINCK
ncbi:late embryogenesis abundant protein At1g64065-like [Humulus lupulus]|uniref:late embryogenesis abundant protein At1g64065-like n=1 Tax=Humulus lupulus TaxID=3486 RepID=UPI002B40435D|nr:late embryogenesis abundant protein At1g64065-like [Humulus lupulus]